MCEGTHYTRSPVVQGSGILFLVKQFPTSPFAPGIINYSLAYGASTLSLNVIVTIFIAARLLKCRWRFGKVLGVEHVSHYSNLAAIAVESALLYSLFLITCIVSVIVNSPLAQLSFQSICQVQAVSSLLLIFRVAIGRAWTEDTSIQILAYSDQNAKCIGMPTSESRARSRIAATEDGNNGEGVSDSHV